MKRLLFLLVLSGCAGRVSISELQARQAAIEERIQRQHLAVQWLDDIIRDSGKPDDREFVEDLTNGEFTGTISEYRDMQILIGKKLVEDRMRIERQISIELAK